MVQTVVKEQGGEGGEGGVPAFNPWEGYITK